MKEKSIRIIFLAIVIIIIGFAIYYIISNNQTISKNAEVRKRRRRNR